MDTKKRSRDSEADAENCNKSSKSTRELIQPGLVLIRNYLTKEQQLEIVEQVFDYTSDFYVPKLKMYGKECKMHLNMTCLGKHWDSLTYKYNSERRSGIDEQDVKEIPEEWINMAVEANTQVTKLDSTIPKQFAPDVVIINKYNPGDRLGFHQDNSENKHLLKSGSPIVSLSIGDSCQFEFYQPGKKKDGIEKIVLHSGDLLVFGGPSKMIYHGVTKILNHTAPNWLSNESKLKEGRVNLTFRQTM